MQSSAEQHIFVTGACGAGKSTLAKALSQQLQLPLHRLDDDPDFRPDAFGRTLAPQGDGSTAVCPVASPPSACGPGGSQAPPAAHHRGHPHPDCPRVDHRAQTDLGRYALAPNYPAISGAGSRQVRRGPRTVRRSLCGCAQLSGCPAARGTRPADLRKPATRARRLPAPHWGRNCAKSCVHNLAAKAGEWEGYWVRSCIVNQALGRTTACS
jgi:hypothetical protein